MSDAYTKLFSSITESTIWSEPAGTRLVWITFLAKCNRHGEVFGSVPGIARLANVTLTDCEQALATLLGPDSYSRTPDNEGRRIEPIDGGWRILNHAKFDRQRSESEAAEREKERKREWDRQHRPSGYERAKKSELSPTQSDASPTESVPPLALAPDVDVKQDQPLLSSATPTDPKPAASPKPENHPPADLSARRAERLATVADDAIEAYNRILAKPKGLLAAVHRSVGRKKRQEQVRRVLQTASEICEDQYANKRVTPEFWQAYFDACDADPFMRGDGPYSGQHANWRPDFEYLTRVVTMLKVFERSTDQADAG